MADELIVSVKEMRQLLGVDYANLSDQEIKMMVIQLELMAEISVKRIKKDLLVPKST